MAKRKPRLDPAWERQPGKALWSQCDYGKPGSAYRRMLDDPKNAEAAEWLQRFDAEFYGLDATREEAEAGETLLTAEERLERSRASDAARRDVSTPVRSRPRTPAETALGDAMPVYLPDAVEHTTPEDLLVAKQEAAIAASELATRRLWRDLDALATNQDQDEEETA